MANVCGNAKRGQKRHQIPWNWSYTGGYEHLHLGAGNQTQTLSRKAASAPND